MDLFAILRSIRRHWLITTLVVAFTGAACAWVIVVMPRDYQAQASYVLVNPAPTPSDMEIELKPSLAGINRNNPYLRFANEGTVGQVLSARMTGGTVRDALVGRGADPGYTIAPSPTSAQIIDIVGTGSSAAEAERTLALVSERMQAELEALQRVYGADSSALITPLPVAEPTGGYAVVSGTIRSLVGVLGAGVIVLFAAISIAEGRAALRPEQDVASRSPAGRHLAPTDEDDGGADSDALAPSDRRAQSMHAPAGAVSDTSASPGDGHADRTGPERPVAAQARAPEPAVPRLRG